jgi:hypothetical protein
MHDKPLHTITLDVETASEVVFMLESGCDQLRRSITKRRGLFDETDTARAIASLRRLSDVATELRVFIARSYGGAA